MFRQALLLGFPAAGHGYYPFARLPPARVSTRMGERERLRAYELAMPRWSTICSASSTVLRMSSSSASPPMRSKRPSCRPFTTSGFANSSRAIYARGKRLTRASRPSSSTRRVWRNVARRRGAMGGARPGRRAGSYWSEIRARPRTPPRGDPARPCGSADVSSSPPKSATRRVYVPGDPRGGTAMRPGGPRAHARHGP
jgi:hypothetical protein